MRLGNLKLAHYGAVSYMTQLGGKCGIKVEERFFAKGPDVMQAIIAGEIDVGVTRGGIQEILLIAELAQAGLSFADQPGKDVRITYLLYPDLNQALLTNNLDVIMQTEPQSSQAIAKGFGVEVLKPYDTPIGVPIRTLVMTDKLYKEKPQAQNLVNCFVTATDFVKTDLLEAAKKSLGIK